MRAIKSIFFTRFHYEKGSRVLHQVPEGSITPSSAPYALPTPLFDFDSVTTYIIPTQQFCDRLITFCTNHHRVIGYPVCIREGKYERNEFIFNFAVVLDEGVADWVAYGEVVRKLGRLLRELEEQGGFLSREEEDDDDDEDDGAEEGSGVGGGRRQGVLVGSKVYALCEMVLEDLNNYAECMIPIDDSNTINLKLFPTHPPPPPIHPHHVPLLTISLTSLTSPISSDLTLTRILPFINGIHSVSHIAQLADTDLSLTRKALQHLVYYGCLVLLDIFSFGAVYAPTAEMGWFITDSSVQEECARYVRVPQLRFERSKLNPSSASSTQSQNPHDQRPSTQQSDPNDAFPTSALNTTLDPIPPETLITLLTTLRQGLPLKSWVLENLPHLRGIDIRRLITFGLIKGILYRIHKYAIATSTFPSSSSPPPSASPTTTTTTTATTTTTTTNTTTTNTVPHSDHSAIPRSSLAGAGAGAGAATTLPQQGHPSTSTTTTTTRLENLVDEGGTGDGKASGGLPLIRFLDGMHCFDEICTELGLGEGVVEKKVKGVGEVAIVYR